MNPSDADFLAWRRRHKSFEGIAAWLGSSFNLSGAGLDATRCNGAYASAELFGLVQARPLLGRAFNLDDEVPNAPMVALLSAELWRRQFGGDPGVLGRPIKLNGRSAQVIGVMPEGFGFPLRQEIWVPLQLKLEPTAQRQVRRVQVVGKLAEGISLLQGEAELQVAATLNEPAKAGIGVRLTPFVDAYTEELQPVLYLLFGGSLGLLLVVCVNVSGLLTALTIARLPELAVRSTVGATRQRLLGQLMVEMVVLGLIGGLLSLPLSAVGIRAYLASQGGELPSFWMDVRLDGAALAYSLAITALVSLVSIVIPSLRVSGPKLNDVLKLGRVDALAHPPSAFRGIRLILQLALSVTLLIATGLILTSLARMGRLQFGSAPDRVLTAQLLVPSNDSTPGEQLRFFSELERRLEATLGPGHVAFTSTLPGNIVREREIEIEGQLPAGGGQERKAPYLIVSEEYFRLLGVQALQGRLFDGSDRAEGQPVAVVNESFARRHLGARRAVGSRLRFVSSEGPEPWRSIVGVVPDLVLGEASDAQKSGVYVPLEQEPTAWMAVLLRTPEDPKGFAQFLVRSVAAVDREIPVFQIRSLEERLEQMRLSLKTMGQVFLSFGLGALFLSLLGVYGVTAESVVSRSREMAIRLALGGERGDLLRRISFRVLIPVLFGVALGALLSFWASRFLASVLFGLQAWEPMIVAVVGSAVTFAGLLACLLPGSRILRIQPASVLRGD